MPRSPHHHTHTHSINDIDDDTSIKGIPRKQYAINSAFAPEPYRGVVKKVSKPRRPFLASQQSLENDYTYDDESALLLPSTP